MTTTPAERVLVCGGRDYRDWHQLSGWLDRIHRECGIMVVIHGGARGADDLARQWGEISVGIEGVEFRADWTARGKAAGMIRNQRMLDEGRPDLVVAFPGGRGTADMVRRARKAGVEVIEIGVADHAD